MTLPAQSLVKCREATRPGTAHLPSADVSSGLESMHLHLQCRVARLSTLLHCLVKADACSMDVSITRDVQQRGWNGTYCTIRLSSGHTQTQRQTLNKQDNPTKNTRHKQNHPPVSRSPDQPLHLGAQSA